MVTFISGYEWSTMVQLLIRSGRSPEEAMMILVPEAYKNHPTLSIKYPEVFFIYYITDMSDVMVINPHLLLHVLSTLFVQI